MSKILTTLRKLRGATVAAFTSQKAGRAHAAPITPAVAVPKFAIPRERRKWVLFQLHLRGESFASIAAELGITRNSVSQALDLPSARVERALAAKLGTPVQDLFPERFDRNGRRIHQERGVAA